jgi:HAE1 family hydrophobic/amphiphilic exporter-1
MAGATGSVPLRALVEPEVAPGFGSINRQDRITLYPLTLELAPDADPGAVAAGVSAALESVTLPDGYTAEVGGGWMPDIAEDEARTMALLLSVCFVFLLMGVLFESFVLPLSILTSIPLAFLGVYWALYLTRTPLTVMGGVGLVILVGVVVNNGIVLVDVVTRLRNEGLSRTDALVEAGRSRLRPILMTALTTIFGVIPMAVGSSTFVGIPYAPLGRVVAGGMVTGTVLTLFVVPFMYSILDDLRGSALRWLGAVAGRPASGVAR